MSRRHVNQLTTRLFDTIGSESVDEVTLALMVVLMTVIGEINDGQYREHVRFRCMFGLVYRSQSQGAA
jgi:hypothetical protein